MHINLVTKDAFKAIDSPRRLIESEYARVYYKLGFASIGEYGIAFNSDLITPIVREQNGNIWIAVDQNLVVLSSVSGQILLSLILNTNVSFISFEDDIPIVVCECDVLLFNKTLSIRHIVTTPYILNSMERIGSSLYFSTIEGATVEVKLF